MRSPVKGSPVNKFRREDPVNQTVLLTGMECVIKMKTTFLSRNLIICFKTVFSKLWCTNLECYQN